MLERGNKNTRHSHLEHPINNTNNPLIQKTDKGRIYSCVFIINKGYRPKCMANKHPCPKYYTAIYIWIVYIVSTPCTAFLQLLLSKKSTIC